MAGKTEIMAAAKGNKNAVGNEGGKPPYYSDPLELQKACDKYFEQCIENEIPATITGLTLALGFCTRKSLLDYAEKIEFVNIIKRSRLRVECEYEKRLFGNSPTGAIFALKNMDWHDRQELTGKDGESLVPPTITFKDFKNGRP
jgi:hypothetical protein